MTRKVKARLAVVKLSDLEERDDFKMFDQDAEIIAAIASSIKTYGYDPARPMVVAEGPWTEGKNILVEGYQRKAAQEKAGIEDTQVIIRYSKTKQDALDYALREQFDRRNSGDKELFRAIQTADDRSKAGRPSKNLHQSDANSKGRSSAKTAERFGTSSSKVEKARNDPEARRQGYHRICAGRQEDDQCCLQRDYRGQKERRAGRDNSATGQEEDLA